MKEKEIVLTEKELKRCQKRGILKDLKAVDGKVRIPRGPKRLL